MLASEHIASQGHATMMLELHGQPRIRVLEDQLRYAKLFEIFSAIERVARCGCRREKVNPPSTKTLRYM